MNRICISGRLTRDPELRVTPNGVSVTTFTLAVDRRGGGDNKQTDFVDCVAFNKQAEVISKYLGKGKMAGVEGRLQSRTYETKEGDKRKVWEVICDGVDFLSPRERTDDDGADRF